jgi:putative SOS response-associated peptidase YedK
MSETVATKPAFREAFRRGRRCLVPVPVDSAREAARRQQPHLIEMTGAVANLVPATQAGPLFEAPLPRPPWPT